MLKVSLIGTSEEQKKTLKKTKLCYILISFVLISLVFLRHKDSMKKIISWLNDSFYCRFSVQHRLNCHISLG